MKLGKGLLSTLTTKGVHVRSYPIKSDQYYVKVHKNLKKILNNNIKKVHAFRFLGSN